MEENVPLEKESKKKFDKTVKGIKKLLKSGKLKPAEEPEKTKRPKATVAKDRGVVYIGHIPHGFYEEQMRSYFKQFGVVTNVRVARSRKNGKSKGFGFVEFLDKEVAEIVASTMNNYLMDKRLIKAEYIPPEKQRHNLFKGADWVENKKCPGISNRRKEVAKTNKPCTELEWIQEARKQLNKLSRTKTKLRALGIDYDFFTPCDIPESLVDYVPPAEQLPNSGKKFAKDLKRKAAEKNAKNSPSEDAADTSVTDNETAAPAKKKKKESHKEKSMSKSATPVAKPPKAKKHKENRQIGASVRPFLMNKIDDETTAKKVKKNKKSKPEVVPEEVVEEVQSKKEKKIKPTIQKSQKIKNNSVLDKKRGNVKAMAQELMKSGTVTVLGKGAPELKKGLKKQKRNK